MPNPLISKAVGKPIRQQVLQFNGTSDFLTCPVTPSILGFSFAALVRMHPKSTNRRLVSWANASTDGFSYGPTTVSPLVIGSQIYNTGAADVNKVIASVRANTPDIWNWHIVTFIPNDWKAYCNKIQDTQVDTSCAMTPAVGKTLTIGRNNDASNSWLAMEISKFVFHNTATAWTLQQIKDLVDKGVIPSGADVVYDFKGNVLDKSGNANDGTLTGGIYTESAIIIN